MTAVPLSAEHDSWADVELAPGDRLKFPESGNRWWTVRVADRRYAIATRQAPFHPAGTLEYTILDQKRGVRAPCNQIGNGWGDGTLSNIECTRLLYALQYGSVELSRRNSVRTNITLAELAKKRLPDSFLVMGNGAILRTHTPALCEADTFPCSVHRPSLHHMRLWPMHWRHDRGLLERICPEHGTGHPDPDDLAYHVRNGRDYQGVHGCCGCCWDPERPRPELAVPELVEEPKRAPRMSLFDFQALGYLHEVNRLVLHPAGLAMSVQHDKETGVVNFAGIIDKRDDPEGLLFAELEPDLIESVEAETARHAPYRRDLIGQIIQTEDLTSERIGSPEPTWEDLPPEPQTVTYEFEYDDEIGFTRTLCVDLPEHEYVEHHARTCDRPPRGWYCLLIRGHSGSCPTYARWWIKLRYRLSGRTVPP
jgi:hypothetical protein